MNVTELTQNQLDELKNNYFDQLQNEDEDILGNITEPNQISNEDIFTHYEGIYFVNDDFFCSMEDNSQIF